MAANGGVMGKVRAGVRKIAADRAALARKMHDDLNPPGAEGSPAARVANAQDPANLKPKRRKRRYGDSGSVSY